jgi:hypothetical protein
MNPYPHPTGRDVRSGEQPLANQDQEVVAQGDQGPHRPREALCNWHGGTVGLGQAMVGLTEGLVDDGGQQGLASGEVAVDGTAGHAGGLRHCAHGRVLVPCHQMGGRLGDRDRDGVTSSPGRGVPG